MENETKLRFHDVLKRKIDDFVFCAYVMVKKFPKEELYGLASQLRRAAISIMLNYLEGYARRREKVKLNFYEIAHGSTQECKYIIYFAFKQNWVVQDEYQKAIDMLNEIAKMLWSTIDQLEKGIKE